MILANLNTMLEQMPEYLCWKMQSGLDFLTQVREFENGNQNSLLLEYGEIQ